MQAKQPIDQNRCEVARELVNGADRAGFKIRFFHESVGSSPSTGTILIPALFSVVKSVRQQNERQARPSDFRREILSGRAFLSLRKYV